MNRTELPPVPTVAERPLASAIKNRPSAEQRDRVFARFDRKVNTVIAARQLAAAWERLDPEAWDKNAAVYLDKVEADHPAAVRERYREYRILMEEHDRLMAEPDTVDEDGMIGRDDEWIGRLGVLDKKRQPLEGDKDVVFLHQLQTFFKTLGDKHRTTLAARAEFDRDPAAYISDTLKLDPDKTTVQWNGYGGTAILDPEYFESLYPGSNGKHMSGTIWSYVRSRPGQAETINHEDNHNRSESFVPPSRYTDRLMERARDCIKNGVAFDKSRQAGKVDLRWLLNPAADLERLLTEHYRVNENEIVADLDRLADGGMSTYLKDCYESIDAVDALEQETDDPKYRAIIHSARETMEKRFEDHLCRLSRIFHVAHETGTATPAKAAVLLAKPERIRHAAGYLRAKVGPERFDTLAALEPLLCDGSFIRGLTRTGSERSAQELRELLGGGEIAKSPSQRLQDGFDRRLDPKAFFAPDSLRGLRRSLEREGELPALTADQQHRIARTLGRIDQITLLARFITPAETGQVVADLRAIADRLRLPALREFADSLVDNGIAPNL